MLQTELISKLCECYTLKEETIEKYSACFLGMELTRRCNLNCIHCLKGDPQNIDMDFKYIDSAFDQIDTVYHLALSGGEVTLAIDRLKYVLDSIIRHNTYVEKVSIVTNGVILCEDLRNVFDEFRKVVKNPKESRIIISNDRYHKKASKMSDAELERHCRFYRQGRKNIVKMQDCANVRLNTLYRVGRLAQLPKKNIKAWLENDSNRIEYQEKCYAYFLAMPKRVGKNRLKHYGKHLCRLEITALGNLLVSDTISYSEEDMSYYHNGHIMDGIDRIIERESSDPYISSIGVLIDYLEEFKCITESVNNMIHSGVLGTSLFAKINPVILKEKLKIMRELVENIEPLISVISIDSLRKEDQKPIIDFKSRIKETYIQELIRGIEKAEGLL